MGLDYHYDNSPRDIQKAVLIRQLKNAVALQKPLTIHTREADEDILAILKEHVPRDHRVCGLLHYRYCLVSDLLLYRFISIVLRTRRSWRRVF